MISYLYSPDIVPATGFRFIVVELVDFEIDVVSFAKPCVGATIVCGACIKVSTVGIALTAVISIVERLVR